MDLLSQHEALQHILNVSQKLPDEMIETSLALQCITQEQVVSDINMPPFDKSAMDGYACRRVDLGKWMTISETIAAGSAPKQKLGRLQCAKIMTGAAMPEGADMVFMKELAEFNEEGSVRCIADSKNNICYLGEDIQKGEKILLPNILLQPKHMPLLASVGYTSIKVSCKPKVCVITTGSELVEPDTFPPAFKIRNSNASQVMAQLQTMGISGKYCGIVSDQNSELIKHIESELSVSDVVILSGGVSVGDFDLVPDVLKQLGFSIVIDGTAIQPGKPMVFAEKEGKYIFGLSGNPVSSFIQFELYAKPFLYAMQGYEFKPSKFILKLTHDYSRKKVNRFQFVPAQITEDNQVEPIAFHGSAHINAIANADCLIEIPEGIKEIRAGNLVTIRII